MANNKLASPPKSLPPAPPTADSDHPYFANCISYNLGQALTIATHTNTIRQKLFGDQPRKPDPIGESGSLTCDIQTANATLDNIIEDLLVISKRIGA